MAKADENKDKKQKVTRESTLQKCIDMGKLFIEYLNSSDTESENVPTRQAMCARLGLTKQWYNNVFLENKIILIENGYNIVDEVESLVESRKQERVAKAENVFFIIATKGENENARIKAAENIIKIYGTPEQRKRLNGVSVEIEAADKKQIDFSGLSDDEVRAFVRQNTTKK